MPPRPGSTALLGYRSRSRKGASRHSAHMAQRRWCRLSCRSCRRRSCLRRSQRNRARWRR
eukprot:349877-Chlamydomonas_euryale.AAC.4